MNNEPLKQMLGSRVQSTCFPTPPDLDDDTPVPNVIITDDGFQNIVDTKDCVWEGGQDQVTVTVSIAGNSREEVKAIMRRVRKVVEVYMAALPNNERPTLKGLSSGELAYDWLKPCYHQPLIYQCETKADIEDDEETI